MAKRGGNSTQKVIPHFSVNKKQGSASKKGIVVLQSDPALNQKARTDIVVDQGLTPVNVLYVHDPFIEPRRAEPEYTLAKPKEDYQFLNPTYQLHLPDKQGRFFFFYLISCEVVFNSFLGKTPLIHAIEKGAESVAPFINVTALSMRSPEQRC